MNTSFKYKAIDRAVLNHPVEKRGFVQVPLDYSQPEGEKLEIFYRLIPAYGHSVDDPSKPIIVVFNGGPGIASSAYRPLDFDYTDASSHRNGSFDRFKFISGTHRVLIADQRGTDGCSAPLDLTDPNLDGDAVAKYFSSDAQARDYLAVINEVIPQNENFLIISQSYGGMVGIQYLSLKNARKPEGILFTCSALPYEDVKAASLNRRDEQLKLNREIKIAYPDIEIRFGKVRKHLEKHGLNPEFIHGLYVWLGKSEKGVWEKKFIDHLENITQMDKPALEKEFKESVGLGNVLNYILSSANFTPGETDRSLADFTSKEIPFEPWMLDENWTLLQIGMGLPSTARVIRALDAEPPTATPFLSIDEIRKAIENFQLLFVSADNDAYVPAESFQRSYQKYQVEGHTRKAHLPGGHHCIFLEEGHKLLLKSGEIFKRA